MRTALAIRFWRYLSSRVPQHPVDDVRRFHAQATLLLGSTLRWARANVVHEPHRGIAIVLDRVAPGFASEMRRQAADLLAAEAAAQRDWRQSPDRTKDEARRILREQINLVRNSPRW